MGWYFTYPSCCKQSDPSADRNYIVSELPEGYVLWEHVKYNAKKLAEDKKEKGKHSAGVYERQDAYLYGHPHGRKKRFRSPADFFPHMLWLCTDAEGDPRNCSCKICSPDGDEETAVEESVKAEAVVKREVKPVPVASAAPKSNYPFTAAPPLELTFMKAHQHQHQHQHHRNQHTSLLRWPRPPRPPNKGSTANQMENIFTGQENWSGLTILRIGALV
jgi:hypothetical protein